MALNIPIPITDIDEDSIETSRTYALDLEKGRIAGMVDGIEAVNQFIRKALLTPRFKCLIYDNQYGSEIKDRVIDGDVTMEYIESELPRLVTDAIIHDARVLDVYDFEFEIDTKKETLHVIFNVDTIYGFISIEEVI